MSDLTFADLRCQYQTGRSYVISGTGRNRIYGYRTGIQCAIGDIEKSEWCQMVQELIREKGEQELYEQLLQHLKYQNYARKSFKELEFYALQLHANRIFDNKSWVDFVKFNRKYRPEIASSTRLIWITSECCKRPGEITQAMMDCHSHDNRVCCPHCGRWAHYKILPTK